MNGTRSFWLRVYLLSMYAQEIDPASAMTLRYWSLLVVGAAILFAFPLSASAQDAFTGTVSGRVVDAVTGESLPGSTVEVNLSADSTFVTGTATAIDGTFSIEGLSSGTYYVRISFVGYATAHVEDVRLDDATPEAGLGRIALEPETTELDEVEVSAEREYVQFGIDRTIYNTQEQPVNMGGSSLEILENIPSIEVDIDGNISLRGNQSVTVYLNGRPAPMSGESLTSFLSGLAAADIERVEVIPNPSARFEPDGSSGILNIVLKRDRGFGWGGGVNASANTRGRMGGSVNTRYGTGDLNIFTNYGLRYRTREGSGWRYRENRYLDPLTILRQDMWDESDGLSHYLNSSMEYSFTESSTLSMSAILSRTTGDGEEFDEYAEFDADMNPTERYTRDTDESDSRFGMDYRADFKHVFTPRSHELSVEAQYEDDSDDERQRFLETLMSTDEPSAPGSIADRQTVDEWEREREFSFDVDYVRPISEKISAEAGLEADLEWVDNRFFSESLDENGLFTPDSDLNNRFVYAEQQYTAYGVVSADLGKFGAQVGLRFEHAVTNFDLRTTSETFENAYVSLFPSLHLSYEPALGTSIRAAYSKRVRRPNEWQLNPFGDYEDPMSRRMGNPYLTPEYTHSMELSLLRLGESYTITVSPYLRYTVDEIEWRESITDDGVSILTFENFATETSWGAEFITSLTLGQWLKGELSTNLFKQVTEAGDLSAELSNDAIGFRSRLSSTIDVVGGLRMQVSQRYSSPRDIPGGRISARTSTDIALRREWLSDRLSIGLRVRDLFGDTDNFIERDMERYYQELFRERQDRSIQLSVRYTLPGSGSNQEVGRGGESRGRRR